MEAKEYLHSDEINEWDTIFDPPVKCEYTEEQLIRFAEMWADIKVLELLNNPKVKRNLTIQSLLFIEKQKESLTTLTLLKQFKI